MMLQHVKEQIVTFRSFSGFKINRGKPQESLKNLIKQEENVKKITECELTTNPVKYLSIKLTRQSDTLFKDNYDSVWKGIQKDMER